MKSLKLPMHFLLELRLLQRWSGAPVGTPKQTGETLTRENRKGSITCLLAGRSLPVLLKKALVSHNVNISVHLKSIIVFINYCYISSYKSITRATIWFDNVFYVYVFECFILVGLCKLLVKAVCKLACKQVLVAICIRSIASKALKGFIYVFVLF